MTGLSRLLRTTAFKLSAVYMLAFALFASALLVYVGRHARTLIDEQIGQTLQTQMAILSGQYRGGGVRRLQAIIERRARQAEPFLLLLQGAGGETIAGNVGVINTQALEPGRTIEITYQRTVEEGEVATLSPPRPALVRMMQLPQGGRLIIGRDLEERERLNKVLGQAIRILLLALFVFGTLGSFLVARRAIARMDALTASGQTIMEGDLTRRLPVSGSGDELDRLAGSLNTMLGRIGELMRGMREVSDNIAHDLRTPLTRLRNSAEEALRTAKSEAEYRAALERTIEESDGLIRTFNALLMIARAEAGAGADAFQVVDLSELVGDLAEIYGPSLEEGGFRLKLEAGNGLLARGNRELLGQTVANLIDNAVKYGHLPGSPSEIALRAEIKDRRAAISVSDRGPGIPAALRERALERFSRLDESRSAPGSGLGLSLARAVAQLHKGELVLSDNHPGLRVTLEWPQGEIDG
ncbi:MAG: ATP-binding protein [Beijerinckiaceae bacterium]